MQRFSLSLGDVAFIAAILISGLETHSASAVELVGYLPYYRMDATYNQNTLPTQLSMLGEVRYFGLSVASDGTIVPLSGSGSLQTNLDRITTIQQAINSLPVGQRPRLDITIGGAGQDVTFSDIAKTVNNVPCNLCNTFAQNAKTLLDTTGAAGVDIDWENPDAGVERTTSYPDMLKRIKQAVGGTRKVYATVDPTVAISNSVVSGTNAIDGIDLMTYDLGWWGNDPSNPLQGEHSLPDYATNAVDAWTEPAGSHNDRPWVFGTWGNNVPAANLGIGLPFYGHTVTGADATFTYSQLAAGGATTDSNYYTYQGKSVWLPGPNLAAQRVQFAHDRGLQSVFIWELGQDVAPTSSASLLRSAYLKNQSYVGDFNGDHNIDSADFDIWRASASSTSDMRADGNGNGVVDAADYVIWRSNAVSSGSGATLGNAVPEPSTAFFSVILCVVLCASQRRFRG